MIGAVPAYEMIRASTGPTAAQRTALVSDLSKTPSLNQNLPHPTAGVTPTSTAKPAAVSAVKAATPAAASSNEAVYIAAAVAALLVVGVVIVKAKKKKRR
jgi:hypothetical protein